MTGRFGQSEIDEALRLLEQGRLDDIAPEMMDALEVLLNESPEAAGRLEHRPAVGGAIALPEADVSGEAWEAAWARIESQTDATRQMGRSVQRPIGSTWVARLSVAAAIGLAVTGSLLFSDREVVEGLALAGPGDALIESVEVFDDSMSFIHSAVDDDDVSIVWVMEETS